MLRRLLVITAASLLIAPLAFAQEEVTLEPSKDNTLFQNSAGSLSNGAGEHLFAGTTNGGAIRRAVFAFDLAGAVPEGAEVQSVSLDLNMSRTISGDHTVSVHRLTADWGEADSHAGGEEGGGAEAVEGDATWIHRMFDTEEWASPGGDFDETASATLTVDAVGRYTVSSAEMADDVRSWLSDPSSNFGWILIGDEDADATAKRFDSREHASAANRPQLTITYTTGTATERPDLPGTLRLSGNYPNPFARSTTIRFEVDHPQDVRLTLYDALGREARSLLESFVHAGPQGVTVSAEGLPAGTYFYCFAGMGSSCGRMTVLP